MSAPLSSLPRFTAHGTAVSIPMEAAARIHGAAVFASPALAWDALAIKRQKSAERASRTLEGSLDTFRPIRPFPPIMGGSPYATRDTGWHADGCLCRTCSV
jgi:hypothetical protein